MTLTRIMTNVLLAAAKVPQFAGVDSGIHVRTLRSLSALKLIEPTAFQPCFPVPLPTHWRLTDEGRRVVDELERSRCAQ